MKGISRTGVGLAIGLRRWFATHLPDIDMQVKKVAKKKLDELTAEELKLIRSDFFVPDEDDPLSEAWSELAWRQIEKTYPASYHRKKRRD